MCGNKLGIICIIKMNLGKSKTNWKQILIKIMQKKMWKLMNQLQKNQNKMNHIQKEITNENKRFVHYRVT